MSLSQLLLAMRARYRIILLTLAVTVGAAVAISMMLPKTYTAGVSLVVNYRGVDPVTGLSQPGAMMPSYIATQVDIIKSKSTALRVVDELKLADSPAVRQEYSDATNGRGKDIREWLANLLMAKVDVVPSRESSVLNISFKGSDPEFVAAVANSFASSYLSLTVALRTDPVQQATGYITTQIKLLRDQYERAQSRLSKYQEENNIYSADNRLDVETTRLNDLSSQLVGVQSQAMEASSRRRQAEGSAATSPDVLNNPLVQGMRSNLAAAEAKFADTSQRLAPNHPQYIAAKSEVDKLRSNLEEQIRATSRGVSANANILQSREGELRAALSAQKAKVQALNGARDEFNVLTNEMENARRAYEQASARYNQTSLEGQSKQADIAVLTAASPPGAPSGPRVLLNVAMSVVLGLVLGCGAVLILELLDQRVRSVAHLADAFGLPVLGVIDKPRLSARRKKSDVAALPGPGTGAGPALQA